MIPSLFQSYRFTDYLLEQVNHQEARYYLDDMRKSCKAPELVQYTPLAIPAERFKIDWELSNEAVVASASQEKQKDLPIVNLIKDT